MRDIREWLDVHIGPKEINDWRSRRGAEETLRGFVEQRLERISLRTIRPNLIKHGCQIKPRDSESVTQQTSFTIRFHAEGEPCGYQFSFLDTITTETIGEAMAHIDRNHKKSAAPGIHLFFDVAVEVNTFWYNRGPMLSRILIYQTLTIHTFNLDDIVTHGPLHKADADEA